FSSMLPPWMWFGGAPVLPAAYPAGDCRPRGRRIRRSIGELPGVGKGGASVFPSAPSPRRIWSTLDLAGRCTGRSTEEDAMLVSEILRIKGHTLFTTPPERSLLEAVTVMAEHDIGSLVVMDHGRMASMLTFAEVLKALAQRG